MIFTKNVLFKQFLFSSLNTNICLDLAEAYGVYIYCNDLGSIVPPTITTVETIPLFNNYNRLGLKKRNRESLLPPHPPSPLWTCYWQSSEQEREVLLWRLFPSLAAVCAKGS